MFTEGQIVRCIKGNSKGSLIYGDLYKIIKFSSTALTGGGVRIIPLIGRPIRDHDYWYANRFEAL